MTKQLMHRSFRRLFCLFCFLVGLITHLSAQAPDSIKTEDYKPLSYIGVYSQNDLYHILLQSDKYFTNGLHFEYGSAGLDTKYNRVTLVGKKEYLNDYAMSFGEDIHTPEDLTATDVDSLDRPYAGLIYLSRYRFSQEPKKGVQITARSYLGF